MGPPVDSTVHFLPNTVLLSGAVNLTEPEVQKALAKLTASKLGLDESKSVVAGLIITTSWLL